MPFWEHKTLEETQQENEQLDVEISNAQKKAVLAKLKEHNLTLKSFGGSLKAAIVWLRGR